MPGPFRKCSRELSVDRGATQPDTTSIDIQVYADLIRERIALTLAAERLDAALGLLNEVVNESGKSLKTMASKYPKEAKPIGQTRDQLKYIQAGGFEQDYETEELKRFHACLWVDHHAVTGRPTAMHKFTIGWNWQ